MITSTEFLINNKSVPDKLSIEYNAFWENEDRKIQEGVTINGYFFSAFMYWHLNMWTMRKDIQGSKGRRTIGHPDLWDTYLEIDKIIQEAENHPDGKKGIVVVGSRRISKSVLCSSYSAHKGIILGGSENLVSALNAPDLKNITGYMDLGLNNLPEYFQMVRIEDDWKKDVVLGIKDKKTGKRKEWSKFLLRNFDEGNNTEVAAGSTLSSFLLEEGGKGKILACLAATEPCFDSADGWRCSPFVIGCVCAGTKVLDKKGKFINIEDITKKSGIIGYDGKSHSQEPISWLKPPAEKECVRITTDKGFQIECSIDHPLMWSKRYYVRGGKKCATFKKAEDIEVGDHLLQISEISIFGDKQIHNPRLIGMLIGDGYYRKKATPELSISPENIHVYTKESVAELLGGYFDADGSVSVNKPCIKLTSVVKPLLEEVVLQLMKFGVHSNIYRRQHNLVTILKSNVTGKKSIINCLESWSLEISDMHSINNFNKYIRFSIHEKQRKVEELIDKYSAKKINEYSYEKTLKGEFFQGKTLTNVTHRRVIKVERLGLKPVYNLTADATHTYITNGFISHNTSGDMTKAGDLKELVNDPTSYNFLAVVDRETGLKHGMFIPGTKSLKVPKIETPMNEFLGIKKGTELDNIIVHVSDEENGKDIIIANRETKKRAAGTEAWLKAIMYYPLTLEECFLDVSNNIFNIEAAREQLVNLESGMRPDFVTLYKDIDGIVRHKFSDKRPVDRFPIKPSENNEGVIQIWEYPMADAPFGVYTAATDPYSHGESAYSDSLGSTYIYKRIHDIKTEGWRNMIVATYTGRPKEIETWHNNTRLLLEFYKTKTLCENNVMSFISDCISDGNPHKFLETTASYLSIVHPNTTVNRPFGVHMTPELRIYYMGKIIKYTNSVIEMERDEAGNVIKEILGMSRIPDPMLLREMILYKKGLNCDRLVAFGMVLAQADSMNTIAAPATDKKDNRLESYKNLGKPTSPFRTTNSGSPFKLPTKRY